MRRALTGTAVAVLAASTIAGAPQTVADFGSRRITVDDVRAELAELRASGDVQVLLKTTDAAGKAAIVDAMVLREQYALAARAAAVDRDPVVAAEIDRAVTRILAARYAEVERRKVDTSNAALRDYYEAHRADFQARPRVKARHILTKTRPEAEAVLAELRGGADFAALAASRSIDPYTRDKGGELGWISEGVMVASFEEALFALREGQTTGPVASTHGFHVVRADSVQPAAVRTFESVRAAVAERVEQAHLDGRRQQLEVQFPVKRFPDALKALER